MMRMAAFLVLASAVAMATENSDLAQESSQVFNEDEPEIDMRELQQMKERIATLETENTQKDETIKLVQNDATQLAQKNKQLKAQLSRRTQHDAGKSLSPQPKAARRLGGGGGRKLLFGSFKPHRRRRSVTRRRRLIELPEGLTTFFGDKSSDCIDNERLAVMKYELDGQGNPKSGSEEGSCFDPMTKIADGPTTVAKISRTDDPDNPQSLNFGFVCSWDSCTNGATGLGLGVDTKPSETTKIACSRVCMIGGALTRIHGLERKDGTTLSDDYKNNFGYSSPVCTFQKVSLCTKPAEFDAEKCDEGDPTRCETCQVKKELDCYAVVPTGFTGPSYDVYKDICQHVKDPCGLPARFL